ncbi:MAG: ABC transporter permease [Planctomycetes bacterium]|nr:ABC transporter permease [Planctomycetota bacterium]
MRSTLAFLPYVLRTALRARSRSLLTLTSAVLGMMLFTFVQSVDGGVRRLVERSTRPVLVVFQDSRFCPLTSELPVRYAREIGQMEGVQKVLPVLVYINSCRSNLDLVTVHGVPVDELESLYDLDVLSGSLADWRDRSDGALVGARLAERRRLVVGDRVRLGDVDVHVAGIVRSDTAAVDNLAFVPIDLLSLARERQGAATEFLVKVDPSLDPELLAAQIDDRFRSDQARTDTKGMQAFVAAAIGEIAQVVAFARWLGYLGVVVIALVIANTVFISAESRIAEMGVLEMVGMRKRTLMALIAGEGIGLSVVGGLLGTGAVVALLMLWPITLGVEGHGIDLLADAHTALVSVLAAVVVGVLASLPPAIAVARRSLALAVKAD